MGPELEADDAESWDPDLRDNDSDWNLDLLIDEDRDATSEWE